MGEKISLCGAWRGEHDWSGSKKSIRTNLESASIDNCFEFCFSLREGEKLQ